MGTTKQPRNYRRRCNDGGNEIDGKEAKPSSSLDSLKRTNLPASAPKRKFIIRFASDDEEEEEDGALTYKNVRDHARPSSRMGISSGGCYHEFNPPAKEQFSASSSSTAAPVSNVISEDLVKQVSDMDLVMRSGKRLSGLKMIPPYKESLATVRDVAALVRMVCFMSSARDCLRFGDKKSTMRDFYDTVKFCE